MKLQIEIPDKQLNDLVEETIKGRIKWLLRNDESLVTMIEDHLDQVIEKKINLALVNISVSDRVDSKVKERVPTVEYLKLLSGKVLANRLKPIIQQLRSAVKADISNHFTEEIEALKKEEESGKGD